MPRTMTQKIERSRTNARVALDAYRATGGQASDDLVAISDLVVDLMHLAELLWKEAEEEMGVSEVGVYGAVSPSGLLRAAGDEWAYESNPDNANEDV